MADIARVIGKVDGKSIVFYPDGSKWAAAVPKDMTDGEYVLEITAYDVAGNTAYSTGMYFIVDLKHLRVEIRPLNYETREAQELYKILQPEGAHYKAVEQADEYQAEELPQNYTYRTVMV
jgi:hypothetical protein